MNHPDAQHEVEEIVETLEPRRFRRIYVHLGIAAAVIGVLGGVALLWHWTPLGAHIDTTRILASLNDASASSLAPFAAMLAYALGGLVVFPISILIAATVVVFGPVLGTCYALVGSLVSAVLLYELGRFVPERARSMIVGARTARLIDRVAGHGTLAIAIVRLLPLAPYSVISLLAGTARAGRLHYIAGTALGLLPGIFVYAVFADRAMAVLENPRPGTYLLLVAAVALILGASVLLQSYLRNVRYLHERSG